MIFQMIFNSKVEWVAAAEESTSENQGEKAPNSKIQFRA